MRKWIVVGSGLVLGLFSLGLVVRAAIRGGDRDGEGAWGRRGEPSGRLLAFLDNERVKSYLNLSDSQADRLRHILVETQKSTVRNRAELEVREIELRELLHPDKPDRDAVMKKLDEMASLRGELMKQRVEALLAAKSVLTPEQQKKVRSFLEGRHGFGIGPRSGWRFRGPGPHPEGPPKPPDAGAQPGGEPPGA